MGNLKKLTSGIRKNSVKYFASGIHRNYGYEKLSIKSSLMDVYDRFPPQSCLASLIKEGGYQRYSMLS